ncbi:MAG TPA: alpha-2-macroglobulin family protein, partial [Syntrophobacteraceae bacterium]|nr:alpha-2-macroglobulin family protein [Syntrophobacteraceae bacterium]
GEKALALISFPMEVENALVTLERDRVESYTLLKTGSDAIELKRENGLQWSAVIPIQDTHRPNITLSVLYVHDSAYVFQNKGITVTVPRVQIAFKPDKETYLPGETVTVEVETRLEGKPVSAQLAVGVVDEMVYVLQPEIAPDIAEFFHHIRHNQVKTTSSLNFHTYDMATSSESQAQSSSSERPIKMLDRPRRENIDTAAWFPNLETRADGRTRFTFVMPQSLSRWRMTGRAMTDAGHTGQKTAYVISSKDCYLKWSGPTVFRKGDEPQIQMLGFNQGTDPISAEFAVEGIDHPVREAVSLKAGINYLQFTFKAERDTLIRTSLVVRGRPVDTLETAVAAVPRGWATTRSVHLGLDRPISTVPVPEGASNIRLSLAGNVAASFLRVADGLLDYPYGCVEQTASRLIPLSFAYEQIKALGLSQDVIARLHSQIAANRLRLVQMAGPDATFGWWGDLTRGSPFLTAYAYYADWNALRVMGVEAPPKHWEKLLDIYKNQGDREDLLHKATILWLAKEMGLPTRTLWEGVADQAVKTEQGREKASAAPGTANLMEPSANSDFRDMAFVLLDLIAEPAAAKPKLHSLAARSMERLAGSKQPLTKALLLMAGTASRAGRENQPRAEEILAALGPETATIDRAVALLFVRKALSATDGKDSADLFDPGDAWRKKPSWLDVPVWGWQGRPGEGVTIKLKAQPEEPLEVHLTYETTMEEESRLPVKIERRLYRLQPEPIDKDNPPTDEDGLPLKAQYKAVPVENPARVDSGELYLDEIGISPSENAVYRYGVLDVALPPGADTELMPWGVGITGVEESSESRSYPGFQSYSVPIDELKEPMVLRQFIRFSQRGSFSMPPARFFRMYQPEEKAFEPGAYVGRIEVH